VLEQKQAPVGLNEAEKSTLDKAREATPGRKLKP
jgi:hypothetical protein